MAKSFTSGLEGLFSSKVTKITRVADSKTVPKKKKESPKKTSLTLEQDKKEVTSSLDALFQESIDSKGLDSFIVNTSFSKPKTKRTPPKSKGFDDLFTPTVKIVEEPKNQKNKKRVTFTFEEEKLAVLKKIAREEEAFLKDIINRIVTEYLEKYPKK